MTGWYQLTSSRSPFLIREPCRDADLAPGWSNSYSPAQGTCAELGIDAPARSRGLPRRSSGRRRLDGERDTPGAQDVDQRQFLELQVVDPERARPLAPDPDVEVRLLLVEAVEDDVDPLPVLVRLEQPLPGT